jgi:hypothetical protein
VAFHDNFWVVVVGAAAPVIALANLVALPDSYKFIGTIRASRREDGGLNSEQTSTLAPIALGIALFLPSIFAHRDRYCKVPW